MSTFPQVAPGGTFHFPRLFVCVIVVLVSSAGWAQSRSPLDVILALDNSGSMKRNDPDRLMLGAASSFAARLGEDSRVGVVRFDGSARLVFNLTSTSVEGFGANLGEALGAIDYRGAQTDISGGVERAIYELRTNTRESARRVVILLTDGFMDLGDAERNRIQRAWLDNDLRHAAVQHGITIFVIAFTETADFQLIQPLSNATGGSYFRVRNVSDVPRVLDEIARDVGGPPSEPAISLPPSTTRPARWNTTWAALIVIMVVGAGAAWTAYASRPLPLGLAHLTRVGATPEVYALDKRVIRIGRQPKVRFVRNDIVLPDPRVSKSHAEIRFRGGQFYVRDKFSRNGTFVSRPDGSFVRLEPGETVPIHEGSRLVLQGYEYVFQCPGLDARSRRDSDETSAAPSAVFKQCQRCRTQFESQALTSWMTFEVCDNCRAEIDELSSQEASALARHIENDLRDAPTGHT
jgi:uncharacterized protein YegL